MKKEMLFNLVAALAPQCGCELKDTHPLVQFLIKEYTVDEILAVDRVVVALTGCQDSILHNDRHTVIKPHNCSFKVADLAKAMVIVAEGRKRRQALELALEE